WKTQGFFDSLMAPGKPGAISCLRYSLLELNLHASVERSAGDTCVLDAQVYAVGRFKLRTNLVTYGLQGQLRSGYLGAQLQAVNGRDEAEGGAGTDGVHQFPLCAAEPLAFVAGIDGQAFHDLELTSNT